MSKHTIKRMVLIIGTGMLIWFLAGCKNNETLPTEPNESDKQFQEMAETEQILADLAAVLPEALTDPELAEIVWTEVKANSEDEAYALWKEIADKPSKSGITLRNKIRKIVSKRSLGKTSSNTELLLSALDGTEPYQIYIHAFDAWDSTSTLPTTFTPLTIDDVDVTELTVFDSLGNSSILEIDTTSIPDYPIAVVGINENMSYNEMMGKRSLLGKPSTGRTIKITKVKLKRSAWWYEPWWAGKAEVYFRVYDPSANENGTDLDKFWFTGQLAPNGANKQYKCWEKKWYGWTQDKPWRSINLNTGWNSASYTAETRNYRMDLIEYDWNLLVPYDLGSYQDEYSLITILTMTASVALIIPAILAQPSYWVVVAGIWVIGQFIGINDDYIGHKDHFQVAVQSAANNPGVEQTWSDNDFEIKLKVE